MTDANAWIGTCHPNDRLDFEKITQGLPAEAAILGNILKHERVRGLLRIRREASDAAGKAQKQFRLLSLAAVTGGAIAALSSGLLLYGAGSGVTPAPAAVQTGAPPVTQPPATPAPQPSAVAPRVEPALVARINDNRTAIVVVQILGLFLSAIATGVLGSLKLVDAWGENRNKAEQLRREVFNEVLKQAQEVAPEPLTAANPGNAISQAMEFFRRYQHELQITFYGGGSTRHGQTAIRLTWITAGLSAVAAISGILGGLGGDALIMSAFLGIAVPILLSAAQSWRAMGRDGDKAAAYKKAKEALNMLALDLDVVRKKAAVADAAAVRAYFDSVHLVMTTENSAWVPAAKT
jgi:hypothetical protein